jgi:tetratricopeptide (TPR) repeat protein
MLIRTILTYLLCVSLCSSLFGQESAQDADAKESKAVKWLDINAEYKSKDGASFPQVVLNADAGIEVKGRPFRLAPKGKATETIPEALFTQIKAKCDEADLLLNKGTAESAAEAFPVYAKALSMLPDPGEKWHASGWILSRMGECYFRSENYERAERLYGDIMWCPGALGNPLVHLRKGQIHFECGQLDRAADDLLRAYMGGGKQIFAKEDPKYLSFLKTKADDIE